MHVRRYEDMVVDIVVAFVFVDLKFKCPLLRLFPKKGVFCWNAFIFGRLNESRSIDELWRVAVVVVVVVAICNTVSFVDRSLRPK